LVTPVPVAVESKVTIVARVVAIVRDVVIIAFFVIVALFGARVAAELDTVAPAGQADPAVTCASPRTDQWGTFCETPGG